MALYLKFIQVNIYRGKYLEELVAFLKKEKPDIVAMQEVTSGVLSTTEVTSLPLFEYIGNELRMQGKFAPDVSLANPDGAFGNAVYSTFPIVSSEIVSLKEFPISTIEEFHDNKNWPNIPRHIVDVSLQTDAGIIHALSLHGAWTAPPQDTEETVRQAKRVAEHFRSLKEPFLMGVDLNNVPGSKVAKTISEASVNLLEGSGVKQTTHPTMHKITPRGYLIDFIFASRDFKLCSLNVPEIVVSDHLPVVAQLELPI